MTDKLKVPYLTTLEEEKHGNSDKPERREPLRLSLVRAVNQDLFSSL